MLFSDVVMPGGVGAPRIWPGGARPIRASRCCRPRASSAKRPSDWADE
ncbi:hypothetical protein ACRAWD_28890 [Caulobacter segnis]